jgi:hypothetical protein
LFARPDRDAALNTVAGKNLGKLWKNGSRKQRRAIIECVVNRASARENLLGENRIDLVGCQPIV